MKTTLLNLSDDTAKLREEYQQLEKRAKRGITEDDWLWILHPSFTLIAFVVTMSVSGNLAGSLALSVFYLWMPGFIVTTIVYSLLDWVGILGYLEGIYLRRRTTRPWYQRFLLLHAEVERLDKVHKEEQDAIKVALDKIASDFGPTRQRVSDLDYFFRQKKKWYAFYDEEEAEVRKYSKRCVKFLKRVEDATSNPILDRDVLRHRSDILNTIRRSQAQCESLFTKFEALKNWVAPNRTIAPGQTEEIKRNRDLLKHGVEVSRIVVDDEQEDSEENNLPLFPSQGIKRTRINVMPKKGSLVEVQAPPPEVKVRTHEAVRLPKRSNEDYEKLVGNKQDIGLCGELLALEYELKRVTEAEGIGSARRVHHVSKDTDSLGYDISSVLNKGEVFIEVKTTTGKFWTDFYLTENEFATMQKHKERYWIYRVHGLKRESGEGLISIFRGIDEIMRTFSFEPRLYASRPQTDLEFVSAPE